MTKEQLQVHRITHTKQNSWWMNDARGIPLCRVCERCQCFARKGYRPTVLNNTNYVADERIEEDA